MNKTLLVKSLLVCAGVLAGFSFGYPYSLVAAAGAVLLLLIGGVRTERILEGVDWTLLLFFSGLFVVMHGVETSGLAGGVISSMGDVGSGSTIGRIAGLSAVSAVLSNLVSNVPAVMLLKPLTESLGSGNLFWLALAMSSTLAGNLTLIGSVANLIVVQQARRKVEIGFMEYFRVGALITVVTILIGILVLALEVKIAHGAEAAKAGAAGRAEDDHCHPSREYSRQPRLHRRAGLRYGQNQGQGAAGFQAAETRRSSAVRVPETPGRNILDGHGYLPDRYYLRSPKTATVAEIAPHCKPGRPGSMVRACRLNG